MADLDPIIEKINTVVKVYPDPSKLDPNKTKGRDLRLLLIEIYLYLRNLIGNGIGSGNGLGPTLYASFSGGNTFTLNGTPGIIGLVLLVSKDPVFEPDMVFKPGEYDHVAGTDQITITRAGFTAETGHSLVVLHSAPTEDTGNNTGGGVAAIEPWQTFTAGTTVTWDLNTSKKKITQVLTGNLTINATGGENGITTELLVKQGAGNHTVTFNLNASPKEVMSLAPEGLGADKWTLFEGKHIGDNFIWYPKAIL